jgi:argininosuccinate lyase
MILLLLKGARARGYIVALVTLRKDLPVSDNRDIQYNCEGYMALALVV